VSGDSPPFSVLDSQYAVFESAGIVLIYSCTSLAPEVKRNLAALMSKRFFDLSALPLPVEENEASQKVLSLLRPLRAIANPKDQN
jgi:hypothetical protein